MPQEPVQREPRLSRNKMYWLMTCPQCRERMSKPKDDITPFKCKACGWNQLTK